MNCELNRSLASSALDAELSPDQHNLYESHLALCHECREQQTDLLQMRDLMAGLGDIATPPTQSTDLWQRIERDEHSPEGRVRRVLGPLLPQRLPRSVAATLLLLGVALLMWPSSHPLAPPPPGPHVTHEGLELAEFTTEAMLTVWESGAEQIVASAVPTGYDLSQLDQLADLEASIEPIPWSSDAPVRIFLYERIEVHG